ncbi:MAG TPA: DUF1499 domain-containing protein [Stellaceae bacterium]|nr:DUF1499 domain-containing protein [Stellaceae bacterium]
MADATMTTTRPSRLAVYLPRLGFWLAILAGVLLALAPIGWRTGVIHFRTAFWNLMEPAAFVGAGAAVISLLALLWWGRQSNGARLMTLFGLVVGAIFVYYPVQFYAKILPIPILGNKPLPLIHDITTDMANPPVFVATLAARKAEDGNAVAYDPKVGEQQVAAYGFVLPLKTALAPAEAFKRALATAQGMAGWTIVKSDPAAGTIEGSQRTLFMGFTDDFVIRVSADGSGSRIDMRSESRQGRSDFGVNAKRIQRFMEALKPGLG